MEATIVKKILSEFFFSFLLLPENGAIDQNGILLGFHALSTNVPFFRFDPADSTIKLKPITEI